MVNCLLFVNQDKKVEVSETKEKKTVQVSTRGSEEPREKSVEEKQDKKEEQTKKENKVKTNKKKSTNKKTKTSQNLQKKQTKISQKLHCFPTKSHRISSRFGKRSRGDFHTGIDLCGANGDNIYAYKSGKVIKVQYSKVSYGNMILIKHSNGLTTRYAHLNDIKVKLNQTVKMGELIGHMGSTGNSTGNHLHFEVIIGGEPVNPYNYIF